MENQSKVIVIERNKFAALVKSQMPPDAEHPDLHLHS
jgi:hypothetical protein